MKIQSLLAILLLFCLMLCCAYAAAETTGNIEISVIDFGNGHTRTDYHRIPGVACGDYEYFVNEDGSATVTGYRGDESDVVIPSELDGHPVTAIGFDCDVPNTYYLSNIRYGVFTGNSDVTDVVIPDGVTGIGDCAFYACRNLTRVSIPESVTHIGDLAFAACQSMTDLTLPAGVSGLGANPFSGCACVTVSPDHPYLEMIDGVLFTKEDRTLVSYPLGNQAVLYTIPEGTRRIGACAFLSNRALVALSIPEGVTEIGDLAFESSRYLASLTIPGSVTRIGDYAFHQCDGLSNLTIQGSPVIGNWAFRGCKSLANVTLGGVTEIGEYAFYECRNLSILELPDSLAKIGKGALAKCPFQRVVIPDSVTEIGASAFACCVYLEDLTIGNRVVRIGEHAFSGCMSLREAVIPDSVTTLGDSVFSAVGNDGYMSMSSADALNTSVTVIRRSVLTRAVIGSGVTEIPDGAFEFCDHLESVTLGERVNSIGDYAFFQCYSLRDMNLPASVTRVGKSAFSGCTGLADEGGFVIVCGQLFEYTGEASDVVIPDGVTGFGTALAGNENIVRVTIPDSVTGISASAFFGCKNLAAVTIPDPHRTSMVTASSTIRIRKQNSGKI